MIRATQLLDKHAAPDTKNFVELVLTYDQRKRGRLRATSTDGQDVGLFLERGRTLCDGDLLATDDGIFVRIRAAEEHVSCARTEDFLLLTRTAYHLGNRHVPLQISSGSLVYQHDHVLDDMVRGLGLQVDVMHAAFHPESGAYSHDTHSHAASTLAPPAAHQGNVVAIHHE